MNRGHRARLYPAQSQSARLRRWSGTARFLWNLSRDQRRMCVYYMRMARVNVYLPDELARQAREAGINISSLTQEALRRALSGRATRTWLRQVASLPPAGVTHEEALRALEQARDEFGDRTI
jgi:post-segregation antitoxin (ccd killing protein)